MGQKGQVIKCPLGPKAKKQRPSEPAGPSQAAAAELAAVESQSALQNAEDLNNALAAHQYGIASNPANTSGQHDVSSDSEIEEPNPNNHIQFDPPLSPSEGTEGREPTPPLVGGFTLSFGEYIRGSYYKSKQLLEHIRWKRVLPLMFVAYMAQSVKTKQWGDLQDWNKDFNERCACGVGELKTRSVDLVDILSRQKKEIQFCSCTSDQVRLIRMGYFGGSPVHPETAFSIRLLRFHHTLWEQCTVRMQGFSLALDQFLDATSPLILVAGTTQPCLWRKTLSSAVDAYRQMLLMEDELCELALDLSELDKLASNCPRCFGPLQENKEVDEPDYIICFDGNFQHRRHTAASREYDERKPQYPPLFKKPAKVDKWKPNETLRNADPPDSCAAQHTAASDHRGAATWKGCDETGLIGMACRHDHILRFVNVVQSGEKQYYVLALLDEILAHVSQESEVNRPKQLGILYDIGCTLEKSIKKNPLFNNEQLKFGTSVFHSYVHKWLCQLNYNPCLNKGWGLSDGEGLERDWLFLSPLVMPNRYSSTQRRLITLHLRAKHRNKLLRGNAVGSIQKKLKDAKESCGKAVKILNDLLKSNPRYTHEYFATQWTRQRALQLSAMEDEGRIKLEERLVELLDLEEKLKDAHTQIARLRNTRIRNRSDADREQATTLPTSIVALEEAIATVVADLGSDEFRHLNEATSPKARALIRVRTSKQKLYEAKVGILEAQRRWEKHGQGTRAQQSLKQFMRNKHALFKKKFDSYKSQVSKYNAIIPISNLPCPSYEEVKAKSIEDQFWSTGSLSHPAEAWAVDQGTRNGIQVYLQQRSCTEELRRIGREVRQMMLYALKTDQSFDRIRNLSVKQWDPECHGNDSPIDLVQPKGRQAKDVWDESRTVLNAAHIHLRQSHSQDWLAWNTHMVELLRETKEYTNSPTEIENNLANDWDNLIEKCKAEWEINVNAPILQAEGLDDQEALEQTMLMWGEEEEELRVPLEEFMVAEPDEFEVEEPVDEGGDDLLPEI